MLFICLCTIVVYWLGVAIVFAPSLSYFGIVAFIADLFFCQQDAELEQNHSRKVESLCEELKSTAAQEKDERQRMEKAAERYHANLEEIQKLLEAEKRRRIESEAALKERSSYQEEAKEKWQQDANTNEQLEVMLKDAKNTVEILERELDRTEAKVVSKDAEILSLQSESALKIAGELNFIQFYSISPFWSHSHLNTILIRLNNCVLLVFFIYSSFIDN